MSLYFVYLITVLNGVANQGGRVSLSLFALQLDAPAYAIGLLAASFSAFPTFLSLPAGRLIDRYGSRWPLLLGTAGNMACTLVPHFFPTLPAVFIGGLLNGLSFSFYNIALQNLVGLLSAENRRAQAYGNFSLTIAIGAFLGPLFTGFSIDHFGHVRTLLYIALFNSVPLIMLAIWSGMFPGGNRNITKSGNIAATLKDRKVWLVLAASSLVQSGGDVFLFYMPVYLHMLEISATMIGIVLSMFAAACFIVRFGIPHILKRYSPEVVLQYAFYIAGISSLLVPVFQHPFMLGVLAFGIGLGIGCGQPITMMLTFTGSAQGRSGEALGVRLTVNHGTRVVGPIFFGALATAFGLPSIFSVSGLLLGGGGYYSARRSHAQAAKKS